MSRINKYVKGLRIVDLNRLHALIMAGRWIYLKGRPKHPGWIQSMQLRAILREMNGGEGMYVADFNTKNLL